MGGLLGTNKWSNITSKITDGNGALIMSEPNVGLIFAVDLDNVSNYILYAFLKVKPGEQEEGDLINRVVISSNTLSLGTYYKGGTSVVNGGTNVKQFMIGVGL